MVDDHAQTALEFGHTSKTRFGATQIGCGKVPREGAKIDGGAAIGEFEERHVGRDYDPVGARSKEAPQIAERRPQHGGPPILFDQCDVAAPMRRDQALPQTVADLGFFTR